VIYSLTYNASYMVPEIILTTVAAVLIYPPLAKVLARNKLA
jgi:thiamine transporter ThiT